eukprot:CAMPEP_0184864090 /NCGR_PEP_ID=MMETSP0580-20130426/13721_1 /TAXON_ID=1118495 /ORGANISM="Dactyliosolen fragilissimus" /LENGTH=734 /DNA_ID=CAMNT_0027362737 /DNA_START=88 /DNA_END=2292 /DNA_ORIENTATION=-
MGNRVKGRVKKKSIKAASHSSMGSKRKLSRMGKVQKRDHAGLDATFIGRSACLKRLQISLKDFRRLCILKGIYPREPRNRTPQKKKGQAYYHIKDVRALAHEPLLEEFRAFKAFMKKVRKAAGRNETHEARRKDALAPSYTLHHLVKERYPRFVDALADLDDALSLLYLFAALPSEGRIRTKITRRAQSLTASWGAYCSMTSSIVKSFVSVKGVYMEAQIMDCTVRWVIPHSFTQHMPRDVDFRVMLTFLEFYETLLQFVLFKLYADIQVRYPLPITTHDTQHTTTTSIAAHIHILDKIINQEDPNHYHNNRISRVLTETLDRNHHANDTNNHIDGNNDIDKNKDTTTDETQTSRKTNTKTNLSQSMVDAALQKIPQMDDTTDSEQDYDSDDSDNSDKDAVNISKPLKEAFQQLPSYETSSSSNNNNNINTTSISNTHISNLIPQEATKRKHLFASLTFFFSREVPKGYLELVALAYGANVGWEGQDSKISIKDPTITHIILDRPKVPSNFTSLPQSSSREYVQPQWILDSANFLFLLPCSKYAIGTPLPPHLSPWVDHKEEGYTPAYAQEIERLITGNIIMEEQEAEEEHDNKQETNDDNTTLEIEDEKLMEETNNIIHHSDQSDDEEEVKTKAEKHRLKQEQEAKALAKTMMSKKATRLYGRMQHGIAKKQAVVDNLHRKRKEIELKNGKTADGKTPLKAKVERLKEERRTIERDYTNTGGSMKRKRTKNKN